MIPPDEFEPIPNPIRNAPSWTWLSFPHQISFKYLDRDNDGEIQHHIELLDWAVNWDSEPLTSGINSTRLILNGPVRQCVLSDISKRTVFDTPFFDLGGEEDQAPKSAGDFDGEVRSIPTKYLCMLVQTRIREPDHYLRQKFLVLELCPRTDAYRRIGIGCIDTRSSNFDLTNRRTLSLV